MAAAIGLRGDFSSGALRAIAKRSKDGPQARRLLALAAIYDGARRARRPRSVGSGSKSCATGFCASTLLALTGSSTAKAPRQPSRLGGEHRAALARMIQEGPTPAAHSVVRWRIVDLCKWLFEHRGDEPAPG
jgi:hypothetical protein